MTVDDIARVAHEVNRAYCRALGDTSQPAWFDATPEVHASAREGVLTILNYPTPPTPQQMHERWCERKVALGWHYGPVKDEGAKTHPCLQSYELLPDTQRAKDYLFLAVVTELLRLHPVGRE